MRPDTLLATEKFLVDCALYGQVKCLRLDNRTEFMNNDFQTLLRKRGIKHETSCPNSPHQNGTAERHWRTLFEMARCSLLERSVPKVLWPYAVQTAAHIRNRCYYNRTQTTENSTYVNTDYCYKVCGAPRTYIEAMNSPKAPGWEQAMKNELEALKVNDTFVLTALPEGKNLVGGKWVYTVKEDVNRSETLKARYVAKGYSQVHGINYEETFSPTADITSIRILMQLAAQYDLTVHQMDVRAAFLHAPIDHEIYMEQPEGLLLQSFRSVSSDLHQCYYML